MNNSQLNIEALAIVFSLKIFYYFPFGKIFTLITYNKKLTWIFHERTNLPVMTSARLLRYAPWLTNYKNQHRPAEENAQANYLLRIPLKEKNTTTEEETNTVDILSNEAMYITIFQITHWITNLQYRKQQKTKSYLK